MADLPAFVGPYKIIDQLGKGGFATVYLALRNNATEPQRVALKIPTLPENHARFRREAETVAQLKHPNIIRIFDMAETEPAGEPFFTMEYISGGTLREKLENLSCLPREEAMNIARQIGTALSFAHERGVIHRDVNPKNILLDQRQSPTRVILTDFGMVKPLSSVENLTQTVNLIGAFHYFAPEQWNRDDLSPATDIYALAITFFEMLAGRRPFKGDIFTLRDKHLHEPPPLLSSVSPETGPFFDDVLARAIAKNLEDRYQNMDQFIEALEAANDEAELANSYHQNGVDAFAAGTPPNPEQAMQTLKDMIKALAGMRAEYQKSDLQKKLRLLQIQAHYNEGVTTFVSGSPKNIAQVIDVLADKVKILGQMNAEREQADLQKKLRLLQVKATYSDGIKVYAAGSPEDLDQAVDILTDKVKFLVEVRAERERADLQEKLRVLQIKKLHLAAEKAFAEGSPENLTETIVLLEQSIQSLDQLKARRESRNLAQKLQILQAQKRDADNYKNVQMLIENQDYESALACLDIDFIQKGKYTYKDVPRLFWGVVYATQHNGNLPPEWEQTPQNDVVNPAPQQDDLKQDLLDQQRLNLYIALSFIPAVIISGIIGAVLMAPDQVGQLRSALIAGVILIALCWVACSVYFYYQIYRPTEFASLKDRVRSVGKATNER